MKTAVSSCENSGTDISSDKKLSTDDVLLLIQKPSKLQDSPDHLEHFTHASNAFSTFEVSNAVAVLDWLEAEPRFSGRIG